MCIFVKNKHKKLKYENNQQIFLKVNIMKPKKTFFLLLFAFSYFYIPNGLLATSMVNQNRNSSSSKQDYKYKFKNDYKSIEVEAKYSIDEATNLENGLKISRNFTSPKKRQDYITLRTLFGENDGESIYNLVANKENKKYIKAYDMYFTQYWGHSKEESTKRFQNETRETAVGVFYSKEEIKEGTLIGIVGWNIIGELMYFRGGGENGVRGISNDHIKGVMSESLRAFINYYIFKQKNDIRLSPLKAGINAKNGKSIGLIKGLGFKKLGYHYQIRKNEWISIQKKNISCFQGIENNNSNKRKQTDNLQIKNQPQVEKKPNPKNSSLTQHIEPKLPSDSNKQKNSYHPPVSSYNDDSNGIVMYFDFENKWGHEESIKNYYQDYFRRTNLVDEKQYGLATCHCGQVGIKYKYPDHFVQLAIVLGFLCFIEIEKKERLKKIAVITSAMGFPECNNSSRVNKHILKNGKNIYISGLDKAKKEGKEFVIFPIFDTKQNHHNCFIIFIPTKSFLFLEPKLLYRKKTSKKHDNTIAVNGFIEYCRSQNYTINKILGGQQTDDFSCGPLCAQSMIESIWEFINNGKFKKDFPTSADRKGYEYAMRYAQMQLVNRFAPIYLMQEKILPAKYDNNLFAKKASEQRDNLPEYLRVFVPSEKKAKERQRLAEPSAVKQRNAQPQEEKEDIEIILNAKPNNDIILHDPQQINENLLEKLKPKKKANNSELASLNSKKNIGIWRTRTFCSWLVAMGSIVGIVSRIYIFYINRNSLEINSRNDQINDLIKETETEIDKLRDNLNKAQAPDQIFWGKNTNFKTDAENSISILCNQNHQYFFGNRANDLKEEEKLYPESEYLKSQNKTEGKDERIDKLKTDLQKSEDLRLKQEKELTPQKSINGRIQTEKDEKIASFIEPNTQLEQDPEASKTKVNTKDENIDELEENLETTKDKKDEKIASFIEPNTQLEQDPEASKTKVKTKDENIDELEENLETTKGKKDEKIAELTTELEQERNNKAQKELESPQYILQGLLAVIAGLLTGGLIVKKVKTKQIKKLKTENKQNKELNSQASNKPKVKEGEHNKQITNEQEQNLQLQDLVESQKKPIDIYLKKGQKLQTKSQNPTQEQQNNSSKALEIKVSNLRTKPQNSSKSKQKIIGKYKEQIKQFKAQIKELPSPNLIKQSAKISSNRSKSNLPNNIFFIFIGCISSVLIYLIVDLGRTMLLDGADSIKII